MKKTAWALLLFWVLVLMGMCGRAMAQTCSTPTAIAFTANVVNTGTSLISLQGCVPSGNSMAFALVTNPTNGTLSQFNPNNGTVLYTPSGPEGTDNFSFTVAGIPPSGSGTVSSSALVSINVTAAKTVVRHRLTFPDGSPRSGKVSFALTRASQSAQGLETVGNAVTATLDAQGWFQVSLTPNETLFPITYYGVYLLDTRGRQENLGLFNVKPAPSGTVAALNSSTVVDVGQDANLRARYTFASQSAVEGLISLVRAYEVQNGGTAVGTQPKLNLIAGTGVSLNTINDTANNRVNVTVSCPSCPGNSTALSTGNTGALAYYSNTTTVAPYPFNGANRVFGYNAANTAVETKTITATPPLTVTHSAQNINIGITGSTFTLNGLSTASQSLGISNSGCTSPAWTSGSSTHYLCLPAANGSNSFGLVTNGAQDFGGTKTFSGGIVMPGLPITITDGVSTKGVLTADRIWHQQGVFGRRAGTFGTATGLGFVITDEGTNDTQNVFSDYKLNVSTNTALTRQHHFQSGQFYSTTNLTGTLSGTYITASYSGTATASRVEAVSGSGRNVGTGTVSKLVGIYGEVFAVTGITTNAYSLYSGQVQKGGTATLTNTYGLFIENQTNGATDNYAIYTADDGVGGAGARVSIGSAMELRGIPDNGILPAAADNASFIYNADKNQVQISQEGGSFRNLAGFGTRIAKTITGSVSFDLSEASFFDCTLSGNVTQVTATNLVPGNLYQFIVRQNGAGNLTLNESGSIFHFPGGTNPGISLGSNVKDLWTCVCSGTNLFCTVTYDVR